MDNANLWTMLQHAAISYSPVMQLLMDLTFLFGVGSVIWGIHSLRPNSHYLQNGGTTKGVAAAILIGSALTTVPGLLDMVTYTFFARGAEKYVFAYDGNTSVSGDRLFAIKGLLQLFGVYTFIKGWWSLRGNAVHGHRSNVSVKGAVVRILAGAALVNISLLAAALSTTLGVKSPIRF